jgi:hypothetical protein
MRDAALMLCPALAKSRMTAEPMKPDEPVTNIRNVIPQPDQSSR